MVALRTLRKHSNPCSHTSVFVNREALIDCLWSASEVFRYSNKIKKTMLKFPKRITIDYSELLLDLQHQI